MGKFTAMTKVCLQCQKPLITTSKREKVHAACREAFYAEYQRKRYVHSRLNNMKSNISRNRKAFFLGGDPCAACGFHLLTKKRSFFNEVTRQLEEFNLCPNCIALWRCGMMEAFSWKRIKEAAGVAEATASGVSGT